MYRYIHTYLYVYIGQSQTPRLAADPPPATHPHQSRLEARKVRILNVDC